MVHPIRFRPQTGIFFSTAALLALSVLMVFSTTAISAEEHLGRATAFLNKHVLQILLGLVLCAVTSQIPIRYFLRAAFPLLCFSIFALLLTLVPGIGATAGGASRWLIFGPIRFQPGEIAKLSIALYMASYIGRHHDEMYLFRKGVVVPLSVVLLLAALLLKQPDFGSTSIILIVVFVQLVTAARVLHLVGVGIGSLTMLGALILTSPYRLKRFETFLDPFHDASSSGYQLVQSLIAVGSGGIFGEGLGAGKQKLYYLPAAHTDFIFAVIAEELGFIGAALVVLLFVCFAWSGISLARKLSSSAELCALAVGLTALVVVPAFLNMAVVLGLLPTKGLVLPLVAYGGTAMVVNLAVVGILFSLARESQDL